MDKPDRMDIPPAQRPPVRPFTLLDAMILVAATAVGFVGVRLIVVSLFNGLAFPGALLGFIEKRWYVAFAAVLGSLAVPVAAAWTGALILLRLRRPRPPWRRLARQPGWMAACMAMPALAMVVVGLGIVLAGWTGSEVGRSILLGWVLILTPALIASIVLGAWATLLMNRRWRAEASWLDRLGRLLAAYWLAMGGVGLLDLWWEWEHR